MGAFRLLPGEVSARVVGSDMYGIGADAVPARLLLEREIKRPFDGLTRRLVAEQFGEAAHGQSDRERHGGRHRVLDADHERHAVRHAGVRHKDRGAE